MVTETVWEKFMSVLHGIQPEGKLAGEVCVCWLRED